MRESTKERNHMNTLTDLQKRFGTETLEHLDDVEVPVLSGPQRQGDVMVVPSRPGKVEGLVKVPREGIAVVRGENGGNTHLLVGEGEVFFSPSKARGQILGTLVVEKGSTAYLTHPEHGFNGIMAGSYTIKRQREQAEEIRLIAD